MAAQQELGQPLAEGSGYGKCILFGEHFVVYGRPSIASGISNRTTATVYKGDKPGFEIVDNRPATPGYAAKYAETMRESVARMNRLFWKLPEDQPVKIVLGGDLYCASGVGASAANCVAMAKAISQAFNLGLTEEQVNECGLEGDKAYAGNPSGIDNTCSTYGGLVYFKRNLAGGANTINRLKLGQPLDILMVSTGITTKTEHAIESLRKRKDAEPQLYDQYFNESEAITEKAVTALEAGDLATVGALMEQNHRLLQTVGVSCKELDDLVALAKTSGALAAKMTGGGMGGYIVALTPGESQNTVAAACEAAGFTTIKARIQ